MCWSPHVPPCGQDMPRLYDLRSDNLSDQEAPIPVCTAINIAVQGHRILIMDNIAKQEESTRDVYMDEICGPMDVILDRHGCLVLQARRVGLPAICLPSVPFTRWPSASPRASRSISAHGSSTAGALTLCEARPRHRHCHDPATTAQGQIGAPFTTPPHCHAH